jgi:hypothetical protein
MKRISYFATVLAVLLGGRQLAKKMHHLPQRQNHADGEILSTPASSQRSPPSDSSETTVNVANRMLARSTSSRSIAKDDSAKLPEESNHDELNDELNDEPQEGSDTTKVASDLDMEHELDRARLVEESWTEEKQSFYRDALNLNEDEMVELHRMNETADSQIKEIVQKISDNPSALSDKELHDSYQGVLETYERRAKGILGDDRLNQLKKFRDDFNTKTYARFGTHVKQTGF